MSDNASLKIWQTLQPMVRKEVSKGTESSVKSKKMVVTTAYNASTKTVGVTEAFGKEIQVPVSGIINPNSLTIGTAVWVVALHGNWSNAVVWMLGDGGIGEINAQTFGGKRPNQYLGVAETAANSQKLAGKTSEYYIQHINLLVNSDFSNPVNQRNFNGATTRWSQYTIDRWHCSTIGTILNPSTDCCIYETTRPWAAMQQYIPARTVAGKKITFAVKLYAPNTKIFIQIVVGETAFHAYAKSSGEQTICVSADIPETETNIRVEIGTSDAVSGIKLYWACVYEGTYTTENLPPFIQPDPVVELAKCQKYLMPVPKDAILSGFTGEAGRINLFVPCPYMAPSDTPTIINGDSVYIVIVGNNNSQTCTNWTVTDYADGGVRITTPTTFSAFKTSVSGYVNTVNVQMFVSCE